MLEWCNIDFLNYKVRTNKARKIGTCIPERIIPVRELNKRNRKQLFKNLQWRNWEKKSIRFIIIGWFLQKLNKTNY